MIIFKGYFPNASEGVDLFSKPPQYKVTVWLKGEKPPFLQDDGFIDLESPTLGHDDVQKTLAEYFKTEIALI